MRKVFKLKYHPHSANLLRCLTISPHCQKSTATPQYNVAMTLHLHTWKKITKKVVIQRFPAKIQGGIGVSTVPVGTARVA